MEIVPILGNTVEFNDFLTDFKRLLSAKVYIPLNLLDSIVHPSKDIRPHVKLLKIIPLPSLLFIVQFNIFIQGSNLELGRFSFILIPDPLLRLILQFVISQSVDIISTPQPLHSSIIFLSRTPAHYTYKGF